MHELRARVPESTINALGRRTTRLCELVERATQTSPHKAIRDGGSQLVELLNERLEEIRELHSLDDEDLPDRIRSFAMRIQLAEQKIALWPVAKPRRAKEVARASNGRSRQRRQQKSVRSAA